MTDYIQRIKEFCKNRVFILLVGIFFLFCILSIRLFSLQIIDGEDYQNQLTTSIMQTLSIPASRGGIYDRYGRPLAVNQVDFSVKIDDSVKISIENSGYVVSTLIKNLETSGYSITDTLPITSSPPYKFTFTDVTDEQEWKESIGLDDSQIDISATDTLDHLFNLYELSEDMDIDLKRKTVSLIINCSDRNLMILSLIEVLERNNETIVDELPITKTEPYSFLFNSNTKKEEEWKASIGVKQSEITMSAQDTLQHLVSYFDVPENIPSDLKMKLLSIRYSLYLKRYKKYQPVTVAIGITHKTVAAIEEHQGSFPGVIIDTDSLRYYPEKEYMSHMLGYVRIISDTEYEEYKQYGYTTLDIIGKSGVEKLHELDLNGEDGEMLVEVDALGRRINTIETKEPVPGKDVFLTIDQKLQKTAYDYLERTLTDVLISKLLATNYRDKPISLKQFFSSMVSSNNISLSKILSSENGEQLYIKNIIFSNYPELDFSTTEEQDLAKELIATSIEKGAISTKQMVLVLYEQEKITADEDYLHQIRNGTVTPLSVVIKKLQEGELKPKDTNLDPCTGSVVVTDIHTGAVLVLVSYPSYDNNRLVNNFDNEYYSSLLNDPTSPLVNRPLSQKKAPGSTFKMITAIAGLETGVITPSTVIYDHGIFSKASTPYPRCWIYTNSSATHQNVNVVSALEVSCNYFFYELAFRLDDVSGETGGSALTSITTLNEYMDAFGLNSRTGIELGESAPNMASPDYKEKSIKWQNPDATISQLRWTAGDTVRAAIGQSVNNFAPIHINKYTATLSSGGIRYKTHLIGSIKEPDGTDYLKTETIVENILEIKPANLEAVFKGMLAVTQGSRGSLRGVFSTFPIDVAAKSGTAQENLTKSSHTWFTGFAPYDNPQIAVTVMIPFGEASGSPAAVVARDIIGEYMGLNYEPESHYLENVLAK